MLTKFEILRVGFASFDAFPAPKPKFCSSWPTLAVDAFLSYPSFFWASLTLSCLGNVLLATSLTADL